MANNNVPGRNEAWKDRISTSMLTNRLKKHALGLLELTPSQIKAIEILLKKLIPDLKAVEHSGETKSTTIVIQEYKEPKE